MSIVQFDSQKIEQLLNSATNSRQLNSATNSRQRKMYQALLDKARSQEISSTNSSSASSTESSTEKKAQTLTKGQTETKTTNKKKKATAQSATTEASPTIPQSTKPVTESKLTEKESEVSPQTSLNSQSKEPQKQQSDAETPIFQALGVLILTPYIKDNLLTFFRKKSLSLRFGMNYGLDLLGKGLSCCSTYFRNCSIVTPPQLDTK